MEKATTAKKGTQYWMRAIHRVLGYLALGMVIVYALSGITLIYRTGDFMKRGTKTEQTLAPGMTAEELGSALKIKGIKTTGETESTITFADGTYNKVTGEVSYTKKEVVAPLDRFINLHKLPVAKSTGIAVITTIFGIVLFLLAVTSLFMFKPGSRYFKSNMIYVAIGVVLTVVLLIIV